MKPFPRSDNEEEFTVDKCPQCEGHGWKLSDNQIKEICQNCLGRGFLFVKRKKDEYLVPKSPYDTF
jgi:DnaJ-class molecular chaperone